LAIFILVFMKTLTFAKPLILVLVGLPGAGKSFFARQFADMFSAPLVSYDRIQYELFATPQFSPEEHELVQRLVHYQITELIKTKRSFVVDGGHNSRSERQTLENLSQAHGYGVLTIWVQTDETTARQRTNKRNPRQVDDKFSPRLNDGQFAMLGKRLTPPLRETYVVISGKHAFSTQAKMVLRKLSTPHVEEAAAAHEQERIPERELSPRPRPDASSGRRSVIIS
jgi:predicted kinase